MALLYSTAKAYECQTELVSAEDMAQWWWSVVVVVAVVVAAPGVVTQRTEACQVTPSDTPGKMDVSCDCMQRLAKVSQMVGRGCDTVVRCDVVWRGVVW